MLLARSKKGAHDRAASHYGKVIGGGSIYTALSAHAMEIMLSMGCIQFALTKKTAVGRSLQVLDCSNYQMGLDYALYSLHRETLSMTAWHCRPAAPGLKPTAVIAQVLDLT